MTGIGQAGLLVFAIWAALSMLGSAQAQAQAQGNLRCRPFTIQPPAMPAPRYHEQARERAMLITAAVKTTPHRVLFLGDSLTQQFDAQVWREHMAPRGFVNAGINGDRTEHLLWRLQNGNLDGPAPLGVVLLIGTNDLTNAGRPRPPELVAEGIRANLQYLRQRLPGARILLLALLPRGAAPDAGLRRTTVAVNELIQKCGDGGAVVYADIGGVLLDAEGRLTPEIAPDQLHFSRAGYARLAAQLDPLIDGLLAGR